MALYTDVTYLRQNLLCLTSVYLADEDHCSTPRGSFNNHVDKKRGEGDCKISTLILSKIVDVRAEGSKIIKILSTWFFE